MITEILDNLKEVTLTKNLDDEQVTRKKLSDKLLTEVKETIFQLFYEDFLHIHIGMWAIQKMAFHYR